MQSQITCYGAVSEIGGNKILLESGDTRIQLDFGVPFGRIGMYFNEFLRPRAARGIMDPLLLGLLPPLHGIYRGDLTLPSLWARVQASENYRDLAFSSNRPALSAVYLSHAHLDHTGDLSYLAESIPVVCTRETAAITRAMQVTGPSSMEREMVLANPRAEKDGILGSGKENYRLRTFNFLDGDLTADGERFWLTAGSGSRKGIDPAPMGASGGSIGGLPSRWWPVDHSIPGASGMAVETSAGWVAYTGDIRFHGALGQTTQNFCNELAELSPAVLICEGTHLQPAENRTTEADIQSRVIDLLRMYRGKLAIADFGARNVERLLTFLEIARQTERILLLQPKDIYLLQALHVMQPHAHPAPESYTAIGLFDDPKAAPRPWEVELRSSWPGLSCSAKRISAQPGDFILADSLWDLNDLPDLEGVSGGVYLFSNSRAYDDEQAADLDRLRNWVRWMGLDLKGDPEDPDTHSLHASGHASGPELLQFVKTVRPRTLIPIHTENPLWWREALAGSGIDVHPPEYGKAILLP